MCDKIQEKDAKMTSQLIEVKLDKDEFSKFTKPVNQPQVTKKNSFKKDYQVQNL